MEFSIASNLTAKNGPERKVKSKTVGASAHAGRVRLKTVALPVEHGGWGLSLEPLVLGLILAPSVAGAFLALATMGAFLARHPLKLAVGDFRRGRRFPRTPLAERFVLLYGTIALLAFIAAVMTGRLAMLWPLMLAAPLAIVQVSYDSLGRSRALLPELAGSSALAATASSIALAGGWQTGPALALWAALVARVVPSIIYVRARLLLIHGEQPAIAPVIMLQAAGLAVVSLLAWAKLIPYLAASAFLILLVRAVLGLSKGRQQVTAKQVGIRELCFGAMTILAIIIGYAFSL